MALRFREFGNPDPALWRKKPEFNLKVGQLVRTPDQRVWVVAYVSDLRASIHPLTPKTRTIRVPNKKDFRKKEIKEVNETGDPIEVSPMSVLPSVELEDLTSAEFSRLKQYVVAGGEFPLIEPKE